MNDSYFKTLVTCILISFGLLTTGAVLKFLPSIAMMCGGAPLIYYHLVYLRPRARMGLSQAAIDSVYYFGFLVTVSALGISAVSIASSGVSENVNTVVYQFGVGLFATGYAVIARMHLSSIAALLDDVSPEAIMDRYIKRSLELVDHVETAVVRTAQFSDIVLSKTTEVVDKAHATAEKGMLEVARAFENEMKSTLALARDGIIEIRGLVAESSFIVEREELTRSIKATIEVSNQLNKALGEFAVRSREGAEAAHNSITSSITLDEALRKVHLNIDRLAGSDGALVKSIESIATAGTAITIGTTAVRKAVTSLSEVADSVADTGPTFQKMRTVAKKAYEQLNALSDITERLDGALNKISGMAQSTGALASELNNASIALPELTATAKSLSERLEQTTQVAGRFETQLAALPQQGMLLESTATDVTVALRKIIDAIGQAAGLAETLKANTGDSAKVIDGAKQLLSSSSDLDTAMRTLQALVSGLAASIQTVQHTLAESSNGLKASITSSADTLEADVKRSTAATSLLTDRLIQVAQTIIDRTRAPREAVT